MYSYLTKKLENSKGVIINRITVLAFENAKENLSDIIQDFIQETPETICKVFNWRNEDDVKTRIKEEIEEKGLVQMITRNGYSGFLAEMYFEIPSNIKINEKGEVLSWQSGGAYRINWLYAHTLAELIDKSLKLAEDLFIEFHKRDLEKQRPLV